MTDPDADAVRHRRDRHPLLGGRPRPVADDGDGLRGRALQRPPRRPRPRGPGGRARRSWSGCGARRRPSRPRGCPTRTGSPATCSGSSRTSPSRPTTWPSTSCCAVDQIDGPQTLLAQLAQFQPADTPERLDAYLAPPPRVRGVHRRPHRHHGRRPARRAGRPPGSSPTGPSTSCERHAGDPDRARPSSRRCRKVASDADRERVRDVVREVVYPADQPAPRGPRAGPTYAATREQPGLVSAPDGERALPARDPALDLAGHGARGRPPGGPRRAGDDRRGAAGHRRRRGLRRRTSHAYRRKLATDPDEPGADARGARRPRERGHRPGGGGRAAGVRTAAACARCEVRPVEAFKEKDAPFAYYFPPSLDGSRPGIYYVNTYDLPSRTYLEARLDDLPRGDPGPPLPDQPRDGAPRASTCSAGSAPAPRGGAYVEGWGLYAERLADELGPVPRRRPSASGCSTPRRGARRG